MVGALWTGISGLGGSQTGLDNESNNIANVNTIGFKASRVSFADQMYQDKIGKGVTSFDVEKMYTQGNLKNTGVSYDMALSGDGFFQVKDGADTYYTRAGNFRMGEGGTLEDVGQRKVQGWAIQPVTDDDITATDPNAKFFTNDFTKLLGNKVIRDTTSIETIVAKATDYTTTAESDNNAVFTGGGYKSSATKIADVEMLITEYNAALSVYAEADPKPTASTSTSQKSLLNFPLTGSELSEGDEVYAYIDGRKYSVSFEKDNATTMKKFADVISDTSGFKAYLSGDTTSPFDPDTQTAPELGYLVVEGLIPGKQFRVTEFGWTDASNNNNASKGDVVTIQPAVLGTGMGHINSIKDAMAEAVSGKQIDVFSEKEIAFNETTQTDNIYTFQVEIYDNALGKTVTVPETPLVLGAPLPITESARVGIRDIADGELITVDGMTVTNNMGAPLSAANLAADIYAYATSGTVTTHDVAEVTELQTAVLNDTNFFTINGLTYTFAGTLVTDNATADEVATFLISGTQPANGTITITGTATSAVTMTAHATDTDKVVITHNTAGDVTPNLAATGTTAGATVITEGGTFSLDFAGTPSGDWVLEDPAGLASLVYTSATEELDVTNFTDPAGDVITSFRINEGRDDNSMAASTEVATVTFPDLLAGETLTIAGVTITATLNATGTQIATQLAEYIADPINNANGANASFTGTISPAWTPGAPAGADIVFQSATASEDVTDFPAIGGTATGFTKVVTDQGASLGYDASTEAAKDASITRMASDINENPELNKYLEAFNFNGNLVIKTKDDNYDVEFTTELKTNIPIQETQTVTISGGISGTSNSEELWFLGHKISPINNTIDVFGNYPYDTAEEVAQLIVDNAGSSSDGEGVSIIGTWNAQNPTREITSITRTGAVLEITFAGSEGNVTSIMGTESSGVVFGESIETQTGRAVGILPKNPNTSGREGAGAEFLQIETTINQVASKGDLQLRLDTLKLTDSAFGAFEVDSTGMVTMTQDGARFAIGQIAVARFTDNRGLEPIGDNLLMETTRSGTALFNINNDKMAEIKGGTLELSTADLSESLVNLMVFQRAFEANAKSITTADTILNTLIQLKR